MTDLKGLIEKYRDFIVYAFFGMCTTIVNVIVYYISARVIGLGTVSSTVVAWIFAVLFAFFTNKLWVFNSKSWEKKLVVRELSSFYLCRLSTGAFDVAVMFVSVDILGWNDLIMKIISNVIVIILNYVASKFIIFKKGSKVDASK